MLKKGHNHLMRSNLAPVFVARSIQTGEGAVGTREVVGGRVVCLSIAHCHTAQRASAQALPVFQQQWNRGGADQ